LGNFLIDGSGVVVVDFCGGGVANGGGLSAAAAPGCLLTGDGVMAAVWL
jgi:hypothetical protein